MSTQQAGDLRRPGRPSHAPGADDRRQRQLGVGRDLHAVRNDGLHQPEPDGHGHPLSRPMVPTSG